MRQRGTEEMFGEGIESRCRIAQRHYAPLIGTEHFELRLHQTMLYNSIYRFDTHMLVNTHVWGANAYSAPVLHVRQLQGASPLFKGYADSFEAVWATAKAVDGLGAAFQNLDQLCRDGGCIIRLLVSEGDARRDVPHSDGEGKEPRLEFIGQVAKGRVNRVRAHALA